MSGEEEVDPLFDFSLGLAAEEREKESRPSPASPDAEPSTSAQGQPGSEPTGDRTSHQTQEPAGTSEAAEAAANRHIPCLLFGFGSAGKTQPTEDEIERLKAKPSAGADKELKADAAPKLPRGKARTESIQRVLKRDGEETTVTALVPSKPQRKVKTIVRRLEVGQFQGPQKALKLALDQGRKVVVHVRGRERLRSRLTATLTAFDQHWNLALKDVHEVYFRSKKTHVYRESRKETYPIQPPTELLFRSIDKHHTRNIETLERRLAQLFVRGDSVILVSIPKERPSCL